MDNTAQIRCIRHLAKARGISREQAAWRWVESGCAARWRECQQRRRGR